MIYLCPVCQGKGWVPNGFYNVTYGSNYYSTNLSPEICRSCKGKGYINDEKDMDVEKRTNLYRYIY